MAYAVDALIEFDGVHTNRGNHYDNATSFTCPVNGTYFFTVSIMSSLNDVVTASIEIDNVRLATAFADYVNGFYPAATNSVLIRCNEGQKVFVKCTYAGYIYSSSTNMESSFSGFLVAEI